MKAAPDSPRQSSKADWGHMEPFYLAGVTSAASLPFHYLSLHALISASVAPWDTYNDGDAAQSTGASRTVPEAGGGW